MRFLELFAGAGGLSMGLEAAGMECVGHAEIEPHARAVLRHRWPGVPLYGDVSQLDGAQLMRDHPFDVLTGGSPCQDLSIAGKRAGLAGSRSSLFHVQHRLWMESGAPYLLWENVAGAFSSNGGADFAVILSTLVGRAIAVPRDGWSRGGVASGPDAVAAWRVLDLQYVPGLDRAAPPQRRVRVFVLAARAGGVDPAEVLALSESVCGHPAPRRRAGEGAAVNPAGGVRGGGVVPIQEVGKRTGVSTTDRRAGIGIGEEGDPMFTLQAGAQHGCVAWDDECNAADVMGTLVRPPTEGGHRRAGVLTYDARGNGDGQTINTLAGDHSNRVTDYTPIVVDKQSSHVERDGCVPTLKTDLARQMGPVVCVTGDTTRALTHEGADASEDGTGRGTPIVLPTLTMGAHTAAPGSNGQDAAQIAEALLLSGVGRPRRLTPLECERLMAWPDNHTAVGIDEQGREYKLSDTARYRLCGNGVGSTCTEWIGRRLMALESAVEQAREVAA